MKQVAVASALVALVLLISTAAASSVFARPLAFDLNWHVIGGGGGHSEAGDYILDGTAGQPVAGTVILSGPYDQCAGFWCWGWQFERKNVYLPLVLRNAP